MRAGELLGITVNSFTSVSLEPPLISFCLANSVRSLEEFRKVESFAVNILREDQTEISRKFAQSDDDKWAEVNYRTSARSNPILEPNLAVFECKHREEYECGDHVIVIGHVLHIETNTEGKAARFLPRPLWWIKSVLRRKKACMPKNGQDHLESLRDGRDVYIYGKKVEDVTTDPSFRNSVDSFARLYDYQCEPENLEVMTFESPDSGERVNRCWQLPTCYEEMVQRREAISGWAELHYGF